MVNKFSKCEMRGAVMGITGLFSGIGILTTAKVGGILFDNLSVLAPFIIVGAISFITILILLIPKIRKELDSE